MDHPNKSANFKRMYFKMYVSIRLLNMHLMRLFKQPQKLETQNVFRPINILQKL